MPLSAGPHAYFKVTSNKFAGHGRAFAKLASQTYTIGGLLGLQVGVGTIRPMQAGDVLVGICEESITSSHADYANTVAVNCTVLFRGDEVDCPVSAGTVALTQLGDEADVVNGGLSLTLTESNNDFRQVALIGGLTNRVLAVPMSTLLY